MMSYAIQTNVPDTTNLALMVSMVPEVLAVLADKAWTSMTYSVHSAIYSADMDLADLAVEAEVHSQGNIKVQICA